MTSRQRNLDWLPPGKRGAICFTIDDLHPGKSTDAYEAGGDLGRGALGHVQWLLERHPHLRVTLFITADWRQLSPFVAHTLPAGTMRLDRHPAFIAYLKTLPRTDFALHGMHHVGERERIAEEFAGKDAAECLRIIEQAQQVFRNAGLPFSKGMCPPAWELSDDLARAMLDASLSFVASARDIRSPIGPDSVTAMSGRHGVPLIYPAYLPGLNLLHFTTNFQATSPFDRAAAIVESGGLLAVKAHIVKYAFGHVALDGMDELYRNYLDLIFRELDRRYGDSLWWTSMAEIAARCARTNDAMPAASAAHS
jgi:hypothetical protein